MRKNKIKIVVTDSGLGGINVLKELYSKIKNEPVAEITELIFFNALYSRELGYNDLPDINAKIEMFDRVLKSIEKKFNPGLIVIACNTLSVIYKDTGSFALFGNKIIDIVESAIPSLTNTGSSESNYVIFGTPTTIQSGEYKKQLMTRGIRPERIIQQPCYKLETEIENDLEGGKTLELLKEYVRQAKQKIKINDRNILVLACTHYGFIENSFVEEAHRAGFENITCINPNSTLVNDVLRKFQRTNSGEVNIKVLSQTQLNIKDGEGILALIHRHSPETANAVLNYNHIPDLF